MTSACLHCITLSPWIADQDTESMAILSPWRYTVHGDWRWKRPLNRLTTSGDRWVMTMQTENVWDYPRPAICEPFSGNLRIVHGGRVLAETTRGFRTLETSHPPTYYFPPDAVDLSQLHNSEHRTFANGRVPPVILILRARRGLWPMWAGLIDAPLSSLSPSPIT